jgi:hypothetical protein
MRTLEWVLPMLLFSESLHCARLDNTFLAVEQHILNQRSMRNTQWKAESLFFHVISYLLDLAKCKGVLSVLGDEILYVYTKYTYVIRIYGIMRICRAVHSGIRYIPVYGMYRYTGRYWYIPVHGNLVRYIAVDLPSKLPVHGRFFAFRNYRCVPMCTGS